jgi:hypothetical protein
MFKVYHFISSDKTVISESSTKVAFPRYASLGNLTLKSMCDDSSRSLLDTFPVFATLTP